MFFNIQNDKNIALYIADPVLLLFLDISVFSFLWLSSFSLLSVQCGAYLYFPTHWHCLLAPDSTQPTLDGSLISATSKLLVRISIDLIYIFNWMSNEHLNYSNFRIKFHPVSLSKKHLFFLLESIYSFITFFTCQPALNILFLFSTVHIPSEKISCPFYLKNVLLWWYKYNIVRTLKKKTLNCLEESGKAS